MPSATPLTWKRCHHSPLDFFFRKPGIHPRIHLWAPSRRSPEGESYRRHSPQPAVLRSPRSLVERDRVRRGHAVIYSTRVGWLSFWFFERLKNYKIGSEGLVRVFQRGLETIKKGAARFCTWQKTQFSYVFHMICRIPLWLSSLMTLHICKELYVTEIITFYIVITMRFIHFMINCMLCLMHVLNNQ